MSEAVGETERAPHALELEDLDVVYRVRGTDRQVLRGVTLDVKRGEAYGLVGESGCGKSTAALAIVNYLPRNGRVRSGGIKIDGRDALSLSTSELRDLRSNAVSMVYQNPGAALNPSIRVGKQVAEVFRVRGASASDATEQAQEALKRVQIADPGSVMGRYAHQLSGGMQQRVDHRDGACDRPCAADPRRADDRSRRNRRGGGARPRRRPAGGAAHVRPLHQPQPRDHQEDVRPRRRALRRQPRRGGRDRHDPRRPAPSLHRRPAALRATGRRAQGSRAARHDPRLHAERGRGAAGLRVRRALHARGRSLSHGGARGPLDRRART